MESRLKLRVSRMFRSSFGSCRSRNISDVIPTSNPVFSVSNNRDFHQIEPLLSPKIRNFPSICKPRLEESMGLSSNEVLHRKKVYSVSVKTESSVSSLKKKKKSKKFKRSHLKIKKKKKHSGFGLSSSSGDGWFSSEDEVDFEDEAETFFSSKSFSSGSGSDSDSSNSHRRIKQRKSYRRRRGVVREKSEMVRVTPFVQKGSSFKESFAVVKRSSDPYSDFRTSMVEMIIEKQIFGVKDLEQLLLCFLSLNSSLHHRVIVQAFSEIWETLFSHFS